MRHQDASSRVSVLWARWSKHVKTKVDHSEQTELDFLHTSSSNVECWAFTHLKTLANDLKSH